MKLIPLIVFIAFIFLYFHFNVVHTNKVLASHRLSKRAQNFHCILIWLLPLVWFWFIKEHIKPMDTMTKSKRDLDKSNYYESGTGIWGP